MIGNGQIIRRRIQERIAEFIAEQSIEGFLIMLSAVLSLIIANSIFGKEYILFWQYKIGHFSLLTIINEFLMPIYFLLIGIEIKRELIAGDLSEWKTAITPVIAALGGMIFPALIYFFLNASSPTISGWAIPTATDIAFALAVLSMLGKSVPASLKLLLTTIAVVDDLGAIIVIAIFYSHGLDGYYFIVAALVYGLMWFLNYKKVNYLLPYIFLGVILLFLVHHSGIHSTIAGVLVASTLPYNGNEPNNLSDQMEKWIHLPVNYFILPLFALVNTAFVVSFEAIQDLGNSLSLGIILGLLVGKTVGIFSFIKIGEKIGLTNPLPDVSTGQLLGMAMLGGIGFTMSIFISMLAFTNEAFITSSKLYVILASVLAMVLGSGLLFFMNRKKI